MLFKLEQVYGTTPDKAYTQEQHEALAEQDVLRDLGLEVARKMAKVQTEKSEDSIKVIAELHAYSHETIESVTKILNDAMAEQILGTSVLASKLLKQLELL